MAIERTVSRASDDPTTDPGVDPGSDTRLMGQLIDGSEDALAALYDRHADAVFSAAMRANKDRWIAAEVVQETFLALWNRAELFDPSRGTLSAWLATIARNRAIDRLRSAARHERAANFSSFASSAADDHSVVEWLTASGELIGVAGPQPVPEVALSDKETRASIEEALNSLDPVERRVIVLAYDGGLSQSEIAASLGWPIGTVKTRTRRALRRLRDRLEGPGAGVPADTTGPERGTRENPRSTRTKLPAVGLGDCLAPC
jgi:RNA polymerase sigma-70 factor (ECF subfamily)